jgi:iron complex outermembrane receptor protein
MKAWIKYGFICCLVMAGIAVYGQSPKDTLHLKPVLIKKNKSQPAVLSAKNDNSLADFSQQEGRRFSDILDEYSGIYLKNYGVGQLSSVSLNGGSAAQTNVLWNGIKLNSPTTGQVDLSLFDISGGDRLSIYTTGQNRTESGVNGLGGTLALDNLLNLDRGKTIQSYNVIRLGSFAERIISTSNIYGIGSFRGATKLAFIGSDNDFPFVNTDKIGAPLMHESNAATQQLSFTQQLQYLFRKGITLGTDIWITDADRQLPPVMSSDIGHEHQWDQSYRAMAYLRGARSGVEYSFKTAYLYDHLRYTDPTAYIDSRSAAQAIRNICSVYYSLRHSFTFEADAHYDHEQATSTGFDITRHRELMGLLLSASYKNIKNIKGFTTGISAHGDMQDFHPLPFSPAAYIGYAKRVTHDDNIQVVLNGERNYRIPALNDLYWNEGGNPNLQPEKAWKSSLHTSYSHSFWIRLIADGYYHYVTDWILWHPTQSGIWMPDNVKRVLSRGATISLHLQSKADMKDKGFIVSGYTSYSYTKTTSLDAVSANDNSQNKQLIYVPLHTLTANIQLQYRRFYIRSIHTFTSERYTTTDDSQSLTGYYLTHLEAGKNFYVNGQQIGLSFRVNNIANTQYQSVTDRPMPGRNYEATVRINLSK